MKKITRVVVILSLVLALFFSSATAVADSAYKVPTANPTFTRGSRVSGTFTSVQTVNSVYMRVREARVSGVNYLDSTWAGWQTFSEAPRSNLIDIQTELVGYQSDTAESWYVQFYNYDTSAWDSTWYSLGSLPTSPSGTLTVAVGDAAKVRTFVSAAGAFRLRFADRNTATGGTDGTQTNLYIDMLRARFVYDAPPVSAVTSPASGTQTNAHAYTVTGTASDAGGVTAVDVSTNGGTSWSAATPAAPGDWSTWSYNWSSIPAEGTYNIRSRATDGAGNVETPGPGVNLIVDWTPPVVAGTSPTNGQTNVAVTTAVRATFTEANAMDPSTINTGTFTLEAGGSPVAGAVSYDAGSKTAAFTPTSVLYYSTSYTATLTTGISDQAGNHLASDYTWSFETAPTPPAYKVPTANPTFTRGSRVSGSYTSVQTVNSVYMRVREGRSGSNYYLDSTWASWQSFTEASRSKLVDIQIELVGYQQNTGDSWYVQFYNYDTGAWDSTWYSLGSLPTSPSGTLTVAVGDAAKVRTFVSAAGAFRLRFADGNTVNGGTDTTRTDLYIDMLRARFTYDITPPVSSITAPTDGEQTNAHAYTVTGTSSDPTPGASGVTAVDVSVNGGSTWSAATPGSPGNYATWSYNWSSIPAEGTYNIRSRATDGAGNTETPGPGVNLIVDWTPPVVASTSPTNGQTNVAVTTNAVRATFTEANAMNASTINTSTFLLSAGGSPVTGAVSYDAGSKTATFAPAGELAYGTSYTATLTTGITDQAGNPLAADYSWTFETAPTPPAFIYADDAGWATSGTWRVENYTGLEPPYSTKILVANDAGATATYTVPAGYTRLEVASSKYWSCGYVDVLLDGTVVADDVDLKSPYGSTIWGNVIYTDLAVDPAVSHTLTLRCTGTGGPTEVTIGGFTYPVAGLHFVNVQWLRYW